MTSFELLKTFGIPALVTSGFLVLCKYTVINIKAIKLGLQALLRAQLIHDYNKYTEKGYAPHFARENFENCYAQYHALGANGVMTDLRNKFLKLPTEPENGGHND